MHDDELRERPPLVNDDVVIVVEMKIRENKRFTMTSRHDLLHFKKVHVHFFMKLCLRR